ncbi:MAG: tandem-95 repeat protein [Verrucomicrobia bacterium]|nr:tandem-95 repeat protein [Verrucomicrobiota bacterium]
MNAIPVYLERCGPAPARPDRRPSSSAVRRAIAAGILVAWHCAISASAAGLPPVLTAIPDQVINEDTTSALLPFIVSDPDSALNRITVTWASGNSNVVGLGGIVLGGSGSNLTLRVTPVANASGLAVISLIASDGVNTSTNSFKVTVRSVNDRPVISNFFPVNMDEDRTTAEIPFTVSDVETPLNQLIVTAKAANPILMPDTGFVFGGGGGTRTLVMTPAPNQFGQTLVTVSVSDGQDTTSTDFQLTVGPVNDGPFFVAPIPDLVIDEDTTSPPISIDFDDIDTPPSQLVVNVDAADPFVFRPDKVILTGTGRHRTLRLTPIPNVTGVALFTVTVSDGGLAPAKARFQVTVRPVNDPPTITEILDQVTDEDTPILAQYRITDLETPLANLQHTVVSDNPTLFPPDAISIVSLPFLPAVRLAPAPNQNGTARVTVTVTDTDGASAQTSFRVHVVPVDDPPTITAIANQVVDEDTVVGPLSFTVQDPDTPLDQLVLTAHSIFQNVVPDDQIVISGTGSNRTVTVTPAANGSGATPIDISVADGTFIVGIRFNVQVNAINDAPTISPILDQVATRGATLGPIPFVIGDVEQVPQALTLSRTSDNLDLLPLSAIILGGGIGSNRTVTLKPVAGKVGVANLSLQVTDQGGAVGSNRFSVSVVAQTQAPRILREPADQDIPEGQPLKLEVIATGDGPLTYQWRFKDNDIPNATDSILTIPAATVLNSGEFSVVVHNANGDATSRKANAKVTPHDFGDAPPKYPVLAPNGAAQGIHAGYGLGAVPDAEPDGQPSIDASGDGGDEDGVQFLTPLIPGQMSTVAITMTDTWHPSIGAAVDGQLMFWIDFNTNNVWGDPGEAFGPYRMRRAGVTNITFQVPAAAFVGTTYARFRLSVDNAKGPTGITDEAGEVEDYAVQVGGSSNTTGRADYGDAPTVYLTRREDNGASHAPNTGALIALGNRVDYETNGLPSVGAVSDDNNGPVNDEDGVATPLNWAPGRLVSLPVMVTAPGIARLNLWVDWNQTNGFNNSGEWVVSNLVVFGGTNTVTFQVPSTAKAGTTYARFRLSTQPGTNYFGPAPDGEVEDYKVQISQEGGGILALDWGDAPESGTSFHTLEASGGPRHSVTNALMLGTKVDAEADGQPNSTATGDDLTSNDEDGVIIPTGIKPGDAIEIQVFVTMAPGSLAFVDAWADFNRNGSWADAGENIANHWLVTPGTNRLALTVPVNAVPGLAHSRWRLSRTGGLSPDGYGGDGEVEDHRFRIQKGVDQTPGACQLGCASSDFWITFPGNYSFDVERASPQLTVLGDPGVSVQVTSTALASPLARVIPASGIMTITLDRAVDLDNSIETVETKGVHITSSAPIQVYGLSKVLQSSDGFLALPVTALGLDYVVAAYKNTQTGVPELNGTQFAIVSSQTNTHVTITLPVSTGTHFAGVPFVVTLAGAGYTWQLRNTLDGADLTGALITSDKPIAVFGGHRIANINSSDLFFADYVVEQLPPKSHWGNEFYSTPLATRSGDLLRVIAGTSNTTVTVSGVARILPKPGSFADYLLSSAAAITSDKPILVQQYANSADYDSVSNADPFMVTLPARSHYGASVTLATPLSGFTADYVSIVVPKSARNSVQLGSATIDGSLFANIPGTSFAWYATNVPPGKYTVTADEPVGVIVYGWNLYESFGWSGCVNFGDTTPPVIQCPNTLSVQSANGQPVATQFAVTAIDACDPEVTVTCAPPSGSLFPVGSTVVTCTATDHSGNVAVCAFTVEVRTGAVEDWGDAPSSYPTLRANNGARHTIVSGWKLGQVIDGETDGQPSADALGDDQAPALDDEDGVIALSSFIPGGVATVQALPSTNGFINAWVDWNGNGVWEASEQMATDVPVAPPSVQLSFIVPSAAAHGKVFARFRFNKSGHLGPGGPASEGEVEDYAFNVGAGLGDQGVNPTGGAAVTPASNGDIVVSSLGGSGQDGVSIPLVAPTASWQSSLLPVDLSGVGAHLDVNAFGKLGKTAERFLASMVVANEGNRLSLTATSAMDPSQFSGSLIEIYNQGVLASSLADQQPVLLFLAKAARIQTCTFSLDAAPAGASSVAVRLAMGLEFTGSTGIGHISGANFIGDALLLHFSGTISVPPGPPPALADVGDDSDLELSRMDLTAGGIPSFTLTGLDGGGRSPRLRLLVSEDGALDISWLSSPRAFTLFGAPSLDGGALWAAESVESPRLRHGRRVLRLPSSAAKRFYRLSE